MSRSVRLKDVAKLAGVGIGTASRVLNNHPNVSKQKRQMVLKAMEELCYRPNEIARSLKTQTTKTIGVILMDITNPFYGNVVKGIEYIAYNKNYSLLLADLNCNMNALKDRIDEFRDKNVDGIIFMGTSVNDMDIKIFASRQIPLAIISTNVNVKDKKLYAKFYSVNIDNEKAAYDATQYLIGLGYTKLAYISGVQGDPNSSIPREYGFKKALKENGIQNRQEWNKYGSFTFESGYKAMQALLEEEERPEIVFAFSDLMAMGAAKAVMSRGFRIPEDIALFGFDGIENGKYFHPSISTVKQPRYQMGTKGTSCLIDWIEGKESPTCMITLSHSIIERESTQSLL